MAMGIVNVPSNFITQTGFFEIDTDGGLMPSETPVYSDNFELDTNGDFMPQDI